MPNDPLFHKKKILGSRMFVQIEMGSPHHPLYMDGILRWFIKDCKVRSVGKGQKHFFKVQFSTSFDHYFIHYGKAYLVYPYFSGETYFQFIKSNKKSPLICIQN